MVMAQQSTESFATLDRSVCVRRDARRDQFVRESLTVSFGVVMLYVFGDHAAQVALTEGNDVVETVFAYRT